MTTLLTFTLLLIATLTSTINHVTASAACEFRLDPVYNGRDCSTGSLIRVFAGAQTLADCTFACHNEATCAGVFYNTGLSSCNIVNTQPGDVSSCTVAPGTSYFKALSAYGIACETDVQCSPSSTTCREGRCGCHNGYSYQRNKGICVDGNDCPDYGTTFQRNPQMVELYGDRHEAISVTLQECKDLCLNPPIAFVCKTIEYEPVTSKCTLADHIMLDPGSTWIYSAEWDTYTRDCA